MAASTRAAFSTLFGLATALVAGCHSDPVRSGPGEEDTGSAQEADVYVDVTAPHASLDPECTNVGDYAVNNAGYPDHQDGTCASIDGFTFDDAVQACGGEVKYFTYDCSDFPASLPYQPGPELAWTAYYGCCAPGGEQIPACPGITFPSEGLAALWSFDDGAPTATDSSGNGNTGTFVGDVSYDDTNLPPIPGDVASLDISNGGYVSVPSSPSLAIPGSFSVAAWVRIESTTGEHVVISKDDVANAVSNYNLSIEGNYPFFSLSFHTGSAVGGLDVASPIGGTTDPAGCDVTSPPDMCVAVHGTNGAAGCDGIAGNDAEGGCWILSETPFIDATHPAGTWRFLTGVYDNAAKTLSVYIDCGDVAVGTFATTGVPWTNTDTVQIGLRKYSPGSVWSGGVDNVGIWDLALSPAEVTGTP
jgi:Concanavalin A-like lectin/glucanases superfamily